MAELNMQGEHHSNTFLGHEKKKQKQKKNMSQEGRCCSTPALISV